MIGAMPSGLNSRGQTAIMPPVDDGASGADFDAMSATAQSTSTPPTIVDSHLGSRRLDANSAAPKPIAAIVTAQRAQQRTQARPFWSNRFDAKSPAAAPVHADANEANLSWRRAGPRNAPPRSTGAINTWRTSAASTARGPPRLPERSPTNAASAAAMPIHAGPSRRTRSMPA